MYNIVPSTDMPSIKKRRKFRILGVILLCLIILSIAFAAGMLAARRNELIKSASIKEANYAGKI